MSAAAKIWDPLRKKEVALTPEEKVRQWFIGILRDVCFVPEHMMMSEVSMTFGASSKPYRADIVVYSRSATPLAIVECKRPDVALSRGVLEQALRYDMVAAVGYVFITNGSSTMVFRKDGVDSWKTLSELPSYSEMLSR